MFVLHIVSPSGTTDWPAWVQAIGSILAILAAWRIPEWQRKRALTDARTNDIQREKDHIRRITSALSVEISEALAASARQEKTMRAVLRKIEQAKAQNRPIKDVDPLNPKATVLTDGVIYRQAAADVGRPPQSAPTWNTTKRMEQGERRNGVATYHLGCGWRRNNNSTGARER